jgi:hypothetical protein
MTIPETTIDGIRLTQVGQWVRVVYPDGTESKVIATLTDNKRKQADILRVAGRGVV